MGLRQRIAPGWHTYWTNPGDSGEPPTLDWALPAGWEAGPLVFPQPERMPVGPLMSYGYTGEVVLLTRLTAPAGLPPGAPVTLRGHAAWLVCEKICIPEEADVTLTLPVVAGKPAPGAGAAAIEQTRRAVPGPSPWPASLRATPETVTVAVAAPGLEPGRIAEVVFFPGRWGVMDHAAAQEVTIGRDGITLRAARGLLPEAAGADLDGVLVIREKLDQGLVSQAFTIKAVAASGAGGPSLSLLARDGAGPGRRPDPESHAVRATCPFHKGSRPRRPCRGIARRRAPARARLYRRRAGLLRGARGRAPRPARGRRRRSAGASSSSPRWSSPPWPMSCSRWASASPGCWSSAGASPASAMGSPPAPGYAGSFFTGALATVAATPCTAPFMGAAVGYALTQPPAAALAVFEALGLGLALPFLALSLVPAWRRLLPRPGPWMTRLSQALAFPLYASVAWLVWVVEPPGRARRRGARAGGAAADRASARGCTTPPAAPRRAGAAPPPAFALASAAAAIALAPLAAASPPAPSHGAGPAAAWEPYSPRRLAELRAQGKPVFVNFTAAWCITCLVNERVALRGPAVAEAFARKGVVYLKADWTSRSAEIASVLGLLRPQRGSPLRRLSGTGRTGRPRPNPGCSRRS